MSNEPIEMPDPTEEVEKPTEKEIGGIRRIYRVINPWDCGLKEGDYVIYDPDDGGILALTLSEKIWLNMVVLREQAGTMAGIAERIE